MLMGESYRQSLQMTICSYDGKLQILMDDSFSGAFRHLS